MRSHGARCRRGSSWPTTTSTRGRAPARPALPSASARTWSTSAGVERRRRLLGAGRRSAAASRPQHDARQPHARRRGADARERSEQGDRQHAVTVEARPRRPRRANRPGNGRAIRAYVRRAAFGQCLHVDAGPTGPRADRDHEARDAQPTDRLARLPGPGLSLRSERQRLIASNIANADTPGYVARDMDFAQALQARRPAALPAAQRAGDQPGRPHRRRQRRLERRRGRRRPALRDRRPDQPRPQHRRHGPRARQLRRQRGASTRRRCASSTATCARRCRRSPANKERRP